MWHDNETSIDYLNFRIVAKACAQLIRDAGDEPVSIGISGGWGVGKSSLVRMIESEFESERAKYVVVTFNPWLYQGFEDARTALLQIVGDAVLKQAKSSTTLSKKAEGFVKRINLLRLALRWSSNFGHYDRFSCCHFPFVDGGWQIAQC